jgi:hypothetical protein
MKNPFRKKDKKIRMIAGAPEELVIRGRTHSYDHDEIMPDGNFRIYLSRFLRMPKYIPIEMDLNDERTLGILSTMGVISGVKSY